MGPGLRLNPRIHPGPGRRRLPGHCPEIRLLRFRRSAGKSGRHIVRQRNGADVDIRLECQPAVVLPLSMHRLQDRRNRLEWRWL